MLNTELRQAQKKKRKKKKLIRSCLEAECKLNPIVTIIYIREDMN